MRGYGRLGWPRVWSSSQSSSSSFEQVEAGLSIGNRGFSNGEAVDAIETEKSRIILHELEPGWWILAVYQLFPYHLLF